MKALGPGNTSALARYREDIQPHFRTFDDAEKVNAAPAWGRGGCIAFSEPFLASRRFCAQKLRMCKPFRRLVSSGL